ncbi:Phenylacetate-coenzyme A ligase [Rhodovulum sp. PH10]|uniref:phenylacetate--CoA ligase family protein n=1 Tax=Rhodovulum sp. PH10 TaxID=1187851 RepID=UPI00027C2A6F|nr:AMP-binding protein [Rhodovulum sp. PH10]EJW11125.1 Phenylacetate-coenzyme A ligase [Rhodovulum sp. PH10]
MAVTLLDTPYDDLETRSADARAAAQAKALAAVLTEAKRTSFYFSRALADIDLDAVHGPADLTKVPVTRKADMAALVQKNPPFGGLATAVLKPARVFASPGPIYEPEARRDDFWRYARALWATGLRPGDLLHNCFAYHFTPAGAMMEAGALSLGASVFPAGTGQTDQQVEAAAALKPAAYSGTPDFLRTILEKAEAHGADLSSIRMAHVTGGALLPDTRAFYDARGTAVMQSYGTAELGLIAYESPAHDGLIVDEGVIVEIVAPGTGDPVADGEAGEVLVTLLDTAWPLLRYATGDLSSRLPGTSSCGRTGPRIRGWLGRADQSTKVKGLFVHPHQVAELRRRHPEILHARLVIGREAGADTMVLQIETETAEPSFTATVADSVQTVTRLRAKVERVAPGALPHDGKTIVDTRDYRHG